jgi:diacylglycerol kinase
MAGVTRKPAGVTRPTALDHHPAAKRARDIASAAVFLSIVNAVVVWGLVINSSPL